MTPEQLQQENELLRTIITQRQKIDELEAKCERLNSTNWRFRQAFREIYGSINLEAGNKPTRDYALGRYLTYEFIFSRFKVLFPKWAEEYPEFIDIAEQVNEVQLAFKQGAYDNDGNEGKAKGRRRARLSDQSS